MPSFDFDVGPAEAAAPAAAAAATAKPPRRHRQLLRPRHCRHEQRHAARRLVVQVGGGGRGVGVGVPPPPPPPPPPSWQALSALRPPAGAGGMAAALTRPGRRRTVTAGARIIEWDDEDEVAAIAAATSSEDDGDSDGGGSGGRRDCIAEWGEGLTFDRCSRGLLSVPSQVSLHEGHLGNVRFTSIRRGSCSASVIPMRIATVCVCRCD